MLVSSKICCKPSRGPNTSNYSTTVPVCCIRSDLRVSVHFARRAAQQCALAGGRLGNNDVFFVFSMFWRKIWIQMGN